MRVRVLVLMGLALAGFAGCDDQAGKVPTHPVRGQIMYDGKPAAGVRVFLLPTSAPSPPEVPNNPHGVTGPDGRFSLSTYGDSDGAAEGGYQVVLFWPYEAKEDEEESDEDRLFGWYTAAHSKLAIQVTAGENQLAAFNLPFRKGPPPKSEGVPGRN